MMTERKVVIGPNHIRVCPHSQTYAAWCRGCGKEIDLVTFREAQKLSGPISIPLLNTLQKAVFISESDLRRYWFVLICYSVLTN